MEALFWNRILFDAGHLGYLTFFRQAQNFNKCTREQSFTGR